MSLARDIAIITLPIPILPLRTKYKNVTIHNMERKCPDCGHLIKALFTSTYCSNECEKRLRCPNDACKSKDTEFFPPHGDNYVQYHSLPCGAVFREDLGNVITLLADHNDD
jgi:hypothetical protein